MKRNKWLAYICTLFLLCCMSTACSESDFLDLKDDNHFTEDNFWKDKADAESALAATYSPIKFQMDGYYGAFDGWLNLNSRGDDIFTVVGEEVAMWQIATFQNSPSSGRDPYGYLYTGIQRANVLLANIDKIPASKISDDERSMIKSEAYCLRGFQYYLLVTNYGQVPLRTIPSNEDSPEKAPESLENLWLHIESDFKAAIAGELPVTRPESERGRIEKGTAIAMLGKAYAAQHKYQEAKDVLEPLLSAPYTYGLMANYADNFTNVYENNKESLFELQYSSDGSDTWGNEDGIKLGSSIPQFIGPVASNGWAKLMPSTYVVSQFVQELRPSGSDTKFDKRMYASFFFDPQTYGDVVPNEKWYGNSHSMDDLWTGNAAKMAGGAPAFNVNGTPGKFLLKKYTAYYVNDASADNMKNIEGKSNNVRVLRFAEVLLLYAEACAKTNDVGGANYALGLIRERAGLAAKTFTQAQLMAEIEHQNLLEFFGEGHRFDDLKRWYSYAEIQQIFRNNSKQGAENFKEKHLYYPIPVSELRDNKGMVQNPLWTN
ncbi:RagB/SusD family nutrient uptake outer membrane protein [Dysgonomonas sp. 25]|uniref:RagB/SusD family nutrient uptake outer membrane protein n=1 Tax=Dysgonomonas sp. 25 TaxID=2302933 RepID=UPI0013D5D105|nr:RagB/SusD family nutrient uptake outer membrane protein [Dysgonomonas sp. 25]NDV67321.1 RagB/SusD family nutrient uptake outer membrane protein [Dysgonomonas sp. 25]